MLFVAFDDTKLGHHSAVELRSKIKNEIIFLNTEFQQLKQK